MAWKDIKGHGHGRSQIGYNEVIEKFELWVVVLNGPLDFDSPSCQSNSESRLGLFGLRLDWTKSGTWEWDLGFSIYSIL